MGEAVQTQQKREGMGANEQMSKLAKSKEKGPQPKGREWPRADV